MLTISELESFSSDDKILNGIQYLYIPVIYEYFLAFIPTFITLD